MKKYARSFVSSLVAAISLGSAACAEGASDLDPMAENEQLGTTAEALTVSPERAVAAKLGLPARFAFGLGNDADSGYDVNKVTAYTLGPKMDIHYMYLSGLPGEGGWTDWNSPSGQYVTMHVNAAKSRGVVPMFTLYQAAAWGEGNLGAFNDSNFMTKYWRGVRTMFQRLAEGNVPAIVHIEPDLWGYTQQKGDDPAKVPMKVGALVPECTDLPANVAGFGKCIVRLSRRLSPKVVIGLSASEFGAYTNGVPDPTRVATYLNKVGGAEADIVVIETLDRDAGCFEVGTDPNCKRSGVFYWDENNVRHPNFIDHLAWAKTVRTVTGKPLLWWQMPLGVPSDVSGYAGKYRDNRVRYTFSHAWEFAAAGGIGAVFGTGAPNQTTAKNDGGQFKNAMTKYLASGGNGLR
ncbi:MAG TPA: hypothetical protein VM925_18115 [Labilithrix sp.]|nr:hypothetical protein [Labilithrix sp.]